MSVLADALPYDVRQAGYVQLAAGAPGSDPGPAGPRALVVPSPGSGPHLPYAIQWFLFGVIAIVGWAVLLRASVRELHPRPPQATAERPTTAVLP